MDGALDRELPEFNTDNTTLRSVRISIVRVAVVVWMWVEEKRGRVLQWRLADALHNGRSALLLSHRGSFRAMSKRQVVGNGGGDALNG